MRTIVRAAALLLLLVAIPARGHWTALGDMPQPSRQGNALRFENAQAVAVITALSPEVIRVRITPGREGRVHERPSRLDPACAVPGCLRYERRSVAR